jgi:hypothetical protein
VKREVIQRPPLVLPPARGQDSSSTARYVFRASADPSGAREGQVYANSVSHVPKFYNGTSWLTLQTTATTPAGSSGDIQTNNAGAFGGFTPGTGVITLLGTPSSANLRAALTDESGTGAALFAGGNIGAATATSINGNTFTTGSFTLTGSAGKTFTFSNTLTFTGTDGSTVAAGAGGTIDYLGTAQTFTASKTFGAALITPSVALTDASTVATNAALGNEFRVTLGGNRTLGNPTNAAERSRRRRASATS